ncbi:MAG: hypothetical protein J6Y89_01810, partial [Lachnospiraceae bacterium]|nr:hypothetical protein [Lachnospiraceae bacterium]
MDKKKILIGAGCGVSVIIGIILAIVLTRDKEEAYRDISVFEKDGSVSVDRTGKILEAAKNMKLRSGDTVTVGDESFTRLCLDDDKYIYVSEDTKLKLDASG